MVDEEKGINSVVYMKKICTIMENKMNVRLRELDLTRAQFEIIVYILKKDDKTETQRNIEKAFGLSHTTVIGILKRLEKNGFIEIGVDSKDRRQRNVHLTKKALDFEKEVMRVHSEINDYFEKKFSAEQIELFESAIKVFYEILVENDIK